jgi:MFS family permease
MTSDTRGATRPSQQADRLREYPDFMRLWLAQSVSMLGTSISSVALPLLAVVTLNASAMQVGLLNFAQTLPALPLALFVGVLVDRVRRRRLLICADLGRGVAIGLVPVLALAGALRIEMLYVCMFVVGVLSILFDVAYSAYTPRLLPQSLLVRGNSRLELSRNILSLAGKGIAGAAVSVLRIPLVVALDAVSYLWSAVSLALIRTPDERPAPVADPSLRGVVTEIREGVTTLIRNRYLWPVAVNAAAANFLTQIVLTLFVLYATRDLGLAAGWLGLIFAAGSVGGIAASTLVPRMVDGLGYGRAFMALMITLRVGLVGVGLLSARGPVLIIVLSLLWFVALFGLVGSNICFATLRQVAIRDELRGRVNAALVTMTLGVTPLGSLAAGFLGEGLGARTTVLVASLLMPLPLLLVLFSPVPRLRSVTEAAPEPVP